MNSEDWMIVTFLIMNAIVLGALWFMVRGKDE